MLVDSHCHLPTLAHTSDIEAILSHASLEGVEKVINIGTNLKDSADAIAVASSFPNVYASIGIYPHEERSTATENLIVELGNLLRVSKKVVGVGECGIDVSDWENQRPISDQLDLFEKQVKFSLDFGLPLIIHNRNGDDYISTILSKYKSESLKGVIHCFSSSWEAGQKFLDLGFYLSFSGLITYPSRKSLLETVLNVPLNRFLVETDAPYLVPQGFRGQTNESKYVRIVAQKVADVRGLPFEQICQKATENTCALFKI